MTPSGIQPVTFRFVAQHLNHCATAVPILFDDEGRNLIPMTPAGIEPVTFWFVAQHLNHCATAVPILFDDEGRNLILCLLWSESIAIIVVGVGNNMTIIHPSHASSH